MECCATCAKTAFRSSLNPADPARAIPSTEKITILQNCKYKTISCHLHPKRSAVTIVVTVSAAESTFRCPAAFK